MFYWQCKLHCHKIHMHQLVQASRSAFKRCAITRTTVWSRYAHAHINRSCTLLHNMVLYFQTNLHVIIIRIWEIDCLCIQCCLGENKGFLAQTAQNTGHIVRILLVYMKVYSYRYYTICDRLWLMIKYLALLIILHYIIRLGYVYTLRKILYWSYASTHRYWYHSPHAGIPK
jgi:hypothetical protein